ncbi:hypothetical protein RM610_06575 [Staphylococcus chromogenes]|nr:hypothetical protein [Staphylococcus chromogenes]
MIKIEGMFDNSTLANLDLQNVADVVVIIRDKFGESNVLSVDNVTSISAVNDNATMISRKVEESKVNSMIRQKF